MSLSRRELLGTALAGAATLCLPRKTRAAATVGAPIRRVILVHAPGGIRWSASFDGQMNPRHNPWGLLPWNLVGRGKPPQWGVSRMLVQRPLSPHASDWRGHIRPYLSSDDPAHFNLARVKLRRWHGRELPNLVDGVGELAVVRVTSAPGEPFNSDHGSASRTLMTGTRSGENGIVTALHHALREQLGAGFDSRYRFPAVVVGEPAWSVGVGALAASRPIYLGDAASLPSVSAESAGEPWMRQAAAALDGDFAQSRQAWSAQSVANLVNDKRNAAAHLPQLVDPALRPAAPGKLGALLDGTPVSNEMLAELFALDSALTPRGDSTAEALAALGHEGNWSGADHLFGLNGALAIRLLQMGAPLVSLTLGFWDSHANEVLDPSTHHSHAAQMVLLGRLLAALSFALKQIADPTAPGESLWRSTVVLVCSEFGRGGADIGPDGFNTANGENLGGSDHDSWSAWPLLGGPVAAGGRLVTDSRNHGFFEQNRVFTTLLRGLGVESAASSYLSYGGYGAIPGLIAGVRG